MHEFDLLQSKPNIEPKLFYPTKQVNNKDTIKLIMEPSACNCVIVPKRFYLSFKHAQVCVWDVKIWPPM